MCRVRSIPLRRRKLPPANWPIRVLDVIRSHTRLPHILLGDEGRTQVRREPSSLRRVGSSRESRLSECMPVIFAGPTSTLKTSDVRVIYKKWSRKSGCCWWCWQLVVKSNLYVIQSSPSTTAPPAAAKQDLRRALRTQSSEQPTTPVSRGLSDVPPLSPRCLPAVSPSRIVPCTLDVEGRSGPCRRQEGGQREAFTSSTNPRFKGKGGREMVSPREKSPGCSGAEQGEA